MSYRISTVSEMTGIPRNTLVAWERRYGVIRAVRDDNGYRSYSESDVARILRIKNAQHAGLQAGEAFALLKRQEAGDGVPRPSTAPALGPSAPEEAFNDIVHSLCEALVSYRKEDAQQLLTQLFSVPFETRLERVFFPVLTKIGELWESGKINVAQEHYASGVLRNHLASLLLGLGPATPRGPHVACTTFPGDLHEMAALALAVSFALSGNRVSYLGPNLPALDTISFIQSQRPALLCVSVIHPVTPEALTEYATAISPALPEGTTLVLGGRHLGGVTFPEFKNVSVQTDWREALKLWRFSGA